VFAAETSYSVKYDGGSLPNTKAGAGLKLLVGAKDVHFQKDGKDIAVIPASSISEISYGQDAHRRVGSAVSLGVATLERAR